MGSVPREAFVPDAERRHAYADEALPIEAGQTISQPLMVARMTELLARRPGDRVLEIGTGSGYQAAILAGLGARVTSHRAPGGARRDGSRAARADSASATRSRSAWATAASALPDGRPWDGIIVTAAAPGHPDALRDQLADGGRLVIPVGSRDRQILTVVTRHGDEWTRASGRLPASSCRSSAPAGSTAERRLSGRAGRRSVYSAGHDPCLRRAASGRRRALLRRPHRQPARARPDRHDPDRLLGRRRGGRLTPLPARGARLRLEGALAGTEAFNRSDILADWPTAVARPLLGRDRGPARGDPGRRRRRRQALLAALVVVPPGEHPQRVARRAAGHRRRADAGRRLHRRGRRRRGRPAT